MSRFEIGDRIEIVGEVVSQFPSKIGVIIAKEGVYFRGKFIVRLADGKESVFRGSQLQIPPVTFADLILDTHVSPVPPELSGSTPAHHMRFISREFDIHLRLIGSDKGKSLYGQVTASGIASEVCLITMRFSGGPHSTTVTNCSGEFEFHQVLPGSATLEILVPSRRIVATFDVRGPAR